MKKQNPTFIVIGIVFFILGITTKNYFYLLPAVLFVIAGVLQRNKNAKP